MNKLIRSHLKNINLKLHDKIQTAKAAEGRKVIFEGSSMGAGRLLKRSGGEMLPILSGEAGNLQHVKSKQLLFLRR